MLISKYLSWLGIVGERHRSPGAVAEVREHVGLGGQEACAVPVVRVQRAVRLDGY